MVQSLGVPLTEAGCLMVNGVPIMPGYRPGGGEVARIGAVTRLSVVKSFGPADRREFWLRCQRGLGAWRVVLLVRSR